jgi:hypothetical protein
MPNIAGFLKSVEYLSGIICRYFFSLLVTEPEAPVYTGMTNNFVFNIHCIFIIEFLFSLHYVPIW